MTDRFHDGDPTNNDPPQSAGLYDASRTNWNLYWGGDLEGIRQKIDYLVCLGITAIWISPPVDNINVSVPGAPGQLSAAYHGYHARDLKRLEEHFGDAQNSWAAFDALVSVAHERGLKVIVDFTPNHSGFRHSGEYGSLYDNGTFLGNYHADVNGYFHHGPGIANRYDPYQAQYYTLFDLADINQENPAMDAYLKTAAKLFQQHGADGFRLDGVKHVTWGWQPSFVNAVNSSGESFIFGEWYLEDPPVKGRVRRFFSYLQGLWSAVPPAKQNTADPLYPDAYKLANKSGMSLLDFPLNAALQHVFGAADADFSELDATLAQEARDFERVGSLVTFIDNHDMARFLSGHNNPHRLHAALAFILTGRGIPCIYYGTEQYLHNNTNGGKDPYNRPMMESFSSQTTAYSLIGQLSNLRRFNPAIAYGDMTRRWMSRDVYIYERTYFDNVVLVAINKNDSASYDIDAVPTTLPPGAYTDYLGGLLGGLSINVSSLPDGANQVSRFVLPPHTVAVWSYFKSAAAPRVDSVEPALAQPGSHVTITGRNFATAAGEVKFGATAASVVAWDDDTIKAIVPAIPNGEHRVTVVNAAGQISNDSRHTVLTGALLPVTFKINNAPRLESGAYILLTGNTVELGNWSASRDKAIGPVLFSSDRGWFICASVPAGQTIEFKFVKVSADGSMTWEGGANHTLTTPASGTAEVEVNWQY